jgi:hypothetical protein
MKLDPDFVRNRKIAGDMESGKLFARRRGMSRSHDVIAAVALLALLVVAIATRAPISVEVGDSGGARQSYVAFMIDVLAALGLSIGLAWLLFSRCHRASDAGAKPPVKRLQRYSLFR